MSAHSYQPVRKGVQHAAYNRLVMLMRVVAMPMALCW